MTAFLVACVSRLPASGFASTLVAQGNGPFNVQSDSLFFGVASSGSGGAGACTIDFFSPSETIFATADAAVTLQAVTNIFAGLTISWLDGVSLNTLIQAPGIDTVSTAFSSGYQSQRP